MFRWIKKFFGDIFKIFRTASKIIIDYGKEVIVNAPAVAIMTFGAIGISNLATSMNAHMFITASWLNPTMTIYFLSGFVILTLATIAGKTANGNN